MKIALTGHREKRLKGQENKIFLWMQDALNFLFTGQEEKEVLCGMAKGADVMFGQAALSLASFYSLFDSNKIKLHLCLPCKHYGEVNADRAYWDLMDNASRVSYMQEEWSRGCDDIRDRFMVDNCDILLAVWDGIEAGGVWSTIQYAKSQGKPIIYIDRSIFK